MIVCRVAGTVANASDEVECTSQAIHQLRRLADENNVPGLVVTLLLPPWRFHVGKCYEAAFLGDWQILHLDSLEDSEAPVAWLLLVKIPLRQFALISNLFLACFIRHAAPGFGGLHLNQHSAGGSRAFAQQTGGA